MQNDECKGQEYTEKEEKGGHRRKEKGKLSEWTD
jgi:hypothetical protein